MSEDEPARAERELQRSPEETMQEIAEREDAPEGDALEQAQELRPGGGEPREVGDAPEADALDQSRGLGAMEDDEERQP